MKAVIFDFDGVVLNSEPIHLKALQHVLSKDGLHVGDAEYYAKYLGLSDFEMAKAILTDKSYKASDQQIEIWKAEKTKRYRQLIKDTKELPIIPGLESYQTYLMSLPNPPKIAICSGSMRSEVMIVLERLCEANIFPMADVIVTADNVSKGKPSPEGYLLTLEKLGVSAKDAYAIEDSPSGIKAAKSADLKTLALKTSFDDGRLNEADEIYENFIDLLQHKALSVAS